MIFQPGNGGSGGGAKIQTGSYTGKGTFGSGNRNTLTFDFPPKVVFIGRQYFGDVSDPLVFGTQVGYSRTSEGGDGGRLQMSWSGNSLSWYATSNEEEQLNVNGSIYYYVAIG